MFLCFLLTVNLLFWISGFNFFAVFCLSFSDSDSSDYELAFDAQSYLMDEVGLVESALFERSHEHHLQVQVCGFKLQSFLVCCYVPYVVFITYIHNSHVELSEK